MKRTSKALEDLDRKVVGLLVELPDRLRIWISLLITLLLAACALLLDMTGETLQVDIFFFPLILACVVFRAWGLLFIPVAIVLYHFAVSHFAPTAGELLLKDLVEVGKWAFLSLIVIYSVNKFGDLKRYRERVKQDVDLAKALQKTLLSKDFDLKRIRVLGYIHQCMEVGGDFYYFRPFKKKYIVLAIGDVMGKGIPASLVMAVIMSFFYEWGKKSYSPSFILDKINKRIIDLWGEGSWYSTIFYSVFDEESRELTFANGGHQKGIHLKKDGTISLLEAPGFPVGIFGATLWEETKVPLEPGDRVILFTDGVSEARDPSGQLYSLNRLLEIIGEVKDSPLEEIRDHILNDVRAHAGPQFESDDVALVMMELKEK